MHPRSISSTFSTHLFCLVVPGMAETRELEDFDGKPYCYALISRRCRLHTGPRYKARGLNEMADPGNEIECDQVVWKKAAAGKPVAWSRWGLRYVKGLKCVAIAWQCLLPIVLDCIASKGATWQFRIVQHHRQPIALCSVLKAFGNKAFVLFLHW